MDSLLQFQETLGSLIDIAPEPKKVKRKKHNIKLFYDIHNSDVSSAWAESACEISKSYDLLIKNEADDNKLKDYLKSYEKIIEIGKSISLKEISDLVNEHD